MKMMKHPDFESVLFSFLIGVSIAWILIGESLGDPFSFFTGLGMGGVSVGAWIWRSRHGAFLDIDDPPVLQGRAAVQDRHNLQNAQDIVRDAILTMLQADVRFFAFLNFKPDWVDWYPLECGCDYLLKRQNIRLGAATTKRVQAPPHLEVWIGIFDVDGHLVSKGRVPCVHLVTNVPLLDGSFPQDEQLAKTLPHEHDPDLARQIPPETHHQALKMYVEGLALEGLRDIWVNSVVDGNAGVGFNNLMRSQFMNALTAADRPAANAYLHEILFQIAERTNATNQSVLVQEVIQILYFLFSRLDLQGEDLVMLREISPLCCDAIQNETPVRSIFITEESYAWAKRRQARKLFHYSILAYSTDLPPGT